MRVDRCLTLSLFGPLQQVGFRATGQRLPILMYHSISEDPEQDVHPYYRVATSPRRFAEQMQWLVNGGWTGVSLEDALLGFANGQGHERRKVALTFDDGFRDFYTEAWPVIRCHEFAATVYLPTGFISAKRRCFRDKECLVWDEVRELRSGGIRFGSHTSSHPKLYELPWWEIKRELLLSKKCLEEQLGEEVGGFAYPYAFPQEDTYFTKTFSELLLGQGYRSCVTTAVGRAWVNDDPFCLKRLPANSCDDRALFLAKLEGAYDWLGTPQRAFRQLRFWARAQNHRPDPPPGVPLTYDHDER